MSATGPRPLTMRVDTTLPPSSTQQLAAESRAREAEGYAGLWSTESAHDPFLPLMIAAEHTSEVEIGTSIAVAFARSPMTVAYTAWDLQRFSGGRFILGLGSQVRPHIERRFSMPWSQPSARMREYVLALRSIWTSWQTGEPLRFVGDFYQHTLMTPFFAPEPLPTAPPRVIVAAVGEAMCETAGEVCDGILLHGFTTDRYIREVTLPAVARGLERSGRHSESFEVAGLPLVATGGTQEELELAVQKVRERIAFYASTPAYRSVLRLHGWGDLGEELHRLSLARDPQRWEQMGQLIDDDVLHTFAIVGEPEEIADRVLARFGDVMTRLKFYAPYEHDPSVWAAALAALRA